MSLESWITWMYESLAHGKYSIQIGEPAQSCLLDGSFCLESARFPTLWPQVKQRIALTRFRVPTCNQSVAGTL